MMPDDKKAYCEIDDKLITLFFSNEENNFSCRLNIRGLFTILSHVQGPGQI